MHIDAEFALRDTAAVIVKKFFMILQMKIFLLFLSTRKRIGNRLRWPEPIYMRVGYVSESRFLAGMIYLISMIFGILNKEWSNFKKMLFIFW